MIDVLKRLAELDAQNPNVVQENEFRRPETARFKSRERNVGLDTEYQGATVVWGKNKSKTFPNYDEADRFKNNLERKYPGLKAEVFEDVKEQNLEECGMMDSMGGMSQPHTPASINMTAASGEELSGMLKDIMSLAGLNNTADEMPMSSEPAAQTLEPAGPEMDATTSMRSVIDKMNPEDSEEKTDEEYNTSPDPELYGEVPANRDPAGSPGAAKGRNMTNHPVARVSAMEQQLMAEYKKFINENMYDEPEDDLRSSVLEILKQIYDGAKSGEDMIDNVADELGDFYDEVEQSGDETLMKAYRLAREEGTESEGDPERMAQVMGQAIGMLSQQGMAEESWMHDRSLPPGFYIKVDGSDKPIGPFKDEFALRDTPAGQKLAMLRKQGKAEGFYIGSEFARSNQK